MAALPDVAAGAADEASQRLLPSGSGGIEMTSVSIDPVGGGGGAARRRARVLERLESVDPDGNVDKQKLVDLVHDVLVAETKQQTLRFSTFLMMTFAGILLFGVFTLAWTIVRGLHTRIDHLSDHVKLRSVDGVSVGRPSIVLNSVSRFMRQRTSDSGMLTRLPMAGRGGSATLLYSVGYENLYTSANVPKAQLSTVCAAVDKGELDLVVHFKGGVKEGGWPAATQSMSGPLERPRKFSNPVHWVHVDRKKATISHSALCDDGSRMPKILGFKIARLTGADRGTIEATINCAVVNEAAAACPFRAVSHAAAGPAFQCLQNNDTSKVWTCPELSGELEPTETQLRKMCGVDAGTCYRNLTRPSPNPWYQSSASNVDQMIEPVDSCVFFNATNLQCLRCRPSCVSACKYADAPPLESCPDANPPFPGCDMCTVDTDCRQQRCSEVCIPAHMKVMVRSQALDPLGFNRFRPCCNSSNGVPWTLQSDAGAAPGEKRCYPA